jgi:uroporphyrinogen-III synthase
VPDFAPSPLAGKRVVITRAPAQSAEIAQRLSTLGASPIIFPLVVFAPPDDYGPLDAGLRRLGEFDWLIFTSENAVRAVADRLVSQGPSLQQGGSPRRVAAVGPTTARAAEQAGFPVSYSAKTHSGVALANELGESVRGARIFLPRSNRANPDLPAVLKHHGAQVAEAIAYRTLPPADIDAAISSQISANETDALLFFSPTAVEHFSELFGPEKLHAIQRDQAIVAVGPITAAALKKLGVTEFLAAADTNSKAVCDVLETYFSAAKKQSSMGANRG